MYVDFRNVLVEKKSNFPSATPQHSLPCRGWQITVSRVQTGGAGVNPIRSYLCLHLNCFLPGYPKQASYHLNE